MPEAGRVCDGPESPLDFGEGQYIWWRWKTSSNPCGTCRARNGKLSPVYLGKPHAYCQCDQVPVPRICNVGASSEESTTEEVWDFVGIVPAHSSRTFGDTGSSTSSGSVSGAGVNMGGSSTSGSSDTTTINNDSDDTWEVYEVWDVTTTVREDQYFCGGSLPEYITVTCIDSEFLGFQHIPQ